MHPVGLRHSISTKEWGNVEKGNPIGKPRNSERQRIPNMWYNFIGKDNIVLSLQLIFPAYPLTNP